MTETEDNKQAKQAEPLLGCLMVQLGTAASVRGESVGLKAACGGWKGQQTHAGDSQVDSSRMPSHF